MMKVSTFAIVALLRAITSTTGTVAVGGGSYSNPCQEFGTAAKLNALYNDPPPDGCPDGPSYKCAGVITRSYGGGVGNEGASYGAIGKKIATVLGIDDPVYTVGTSKLTSPVCPADIVDGGEYPPWCPTPLGIYQGGVSFSYLRKDIAPPISILQDWLSTGVNPIRGGTDVPTVAWSGGGIILMQDGEGNPDVKFPEGTKSSFWDGDRFGNTWPMDGSTYGRSLCGNGPTWNEMALGISGPIVPIPTLIFYMAAPCPPYAPGWKDLALPDGYTRSCPASAVESVDSYYENWHSNLEKVFSTPSVCNSDDFMYDIAPGISAKDICQVNLDVLQQIIQRLTCGIAPEYFDKIMIPASKIIPLNWLRELDLAELTGMNISTEEFSELRMPFGLWNEVLVRSWNGLGFHDVAAHLVLWYDDKEGSKETAFNRAEAFFEASGINGGPNIRIPIVYRNDTRLFTDPDAGPEHQELFTCPDTTDDANPTTKSSPSSGAFPTINSSSKMMASLFTVVVMMFTV